jgi:hypothetical protein
MMLVVATDQETALDVLLEYVEELDVPPRRLSWALRITEAREDLQPHEQRLLDDAWNKVKADARQREWEDMGR